MYARVCVGINKPSFSYMKKIYSYNTRLISYLSYECA